MTKAIIRKGTKVTRAGVTTARADTSTVTVRRTEAYKKDKRYVTVFWKSHGVTASARIQTKYVQEV